MQNSKRVNIAILCVFLCVVMVLIQSVVFYQYRNILTQIENLIKNPVQNSSGLSYEDCLEKSRFKVDEIIFSDEDDAGADVMFSTKSGDVYAAYLSKYQDNGETLYSLGQYNEASTHTPVYSGFKNFGRHFEYACVSVIADLRDYDFEGYIPQKRDVTVTEKKKETTYHFYFIDKSQKPHSKYNYAPIYGLLNDEDDIKKAIEICDIVMDMDLDTDVNELGKKLGAKNVKQLPASIPYTYDYELDNDFTLRSHGKPLETFEISTQYDTVVIDVNDKTIKFNR